MKVLGVDEHVWRHTRRGDTDVTVIIDLTPCAGRGPGPRGVRGLLEGRSTAVFTTWLDGRTTAVFTTWLAARDPDRTTEKATLTRLITTTSSSTGVPAGRPDVARLGRTLRNRDQDILAFIDRPDTPNGGQVRWARGQGRSVGQWTDRPTCTVFGGM